MTWYVYMFIRKTRTVEEVFGESLFQGVARSPRSRNTGERVFFSLLFLLHEICQELRPMNRDNLIRVEPVGGVA